MPETKYQKAPERFRFTTDWFCGNEKHFSRYLTHLVDMPCQILEIGSYEGRATVWLLENIATHPQARDHLHRFERAIVIPANVSWPRDRRKKFACKWALSDLLRSFPSNTFRFYLCRWRPRLGVKFWKTPCFHFSLAQACRHHGVLMITNGRTRATLDGLPKPAINAFLSIYKRKITVLMKGYQVWMRRRCAISANSSRALPTPDRAKWNIARREPMNLTNFRFETDSDGIALLTWDMPGAR